MVRSASHDRAIRLLDRDRAGEIFHLTWDRVDLANRVIRLESKDTKTAEPRVVFLCDQAYDILKKAGKVRFLEHNRVFTFKGKPLNKIKKALPNAGRKAEISNFRFHDLRLDDARNVYQKLEALLRDAPGHNLAPAGKCSFSAPEG